MSNKKVSTPVVKKKLSDLRSKPFTFELVHPEMGETGATVTIVSSNTNTFFSKTIELNKKFGDVDQNTIPVEEKMHNTADLYSSVVIGWDEEFFGMECNTENVIKVLSDSENMWILNSIVEALGKNDNFFPKI